MPSALTDAHIAAQHRLRTLARDAVTRAWERLERYDDDQVPVFVALAVPVVLAAQRQSVLLADAYVAHQLGRAPLGLEPATLIGPALRAGTSAEVQWRRPFVTVWTALSEQTPVDDAVHAGLTRAQGMAATDVQLAHRSALAEAQRRDPVIRGYRRVADPGACSFCQLIDGAVVKSASAAALHPGCGCGFEPLTDTPDPAPLPDGVAVREHGELGPTLADPAHAFTGPADL